MNNKVSLIAGAIFAALFSVTARSEDWPQFRGPRRDNCSAETGLLKKFSAGGPKVCWSVDVCQGYAGAAIHSGRVFVNDYLETDSKWLLRCLSLEDGKELWRFEQPKRIRPNHGITRTVPAVDATSVFSLDPKCVLHCLDSATGKQRWERDLVADYKTAIPPWYAGQCPLIEPDRIVIAPAGSALVVALDKQTGKEIWTAPNPDHWPMSHSSLMPAELAGARQYVYAALPGLVGISAADGAVLWQLPWKFNVAVAPSALPIDAERVLMSAGYDAGGLVFRVRSSGGTFAAEKALELPAAEWNAEVHTPILHQNRLFGIGKKKRGLFTCLDLDGKVIWTSEGKASFGLGSFLYADGMFFVLDGDSGLLRLIEANDKEYRELDKAAILSGDNVWGPMALSDGRLVLRDMNRMVCIDVRGDAERK